MVSVMIMERHRDERQAQRVSRGVREGERGEREREREREDRQTEILVSVFLPLPVELILLSHVS